MRLWVCIPSLLHTILSIGFLPRSRRSYFCWIFFSSSPSSLFFFSSVLHHFFSLHRFLYFSREWIEFDCLFLLLCALDVCLSVRSILNAKCDSYKIILYHCVCLLLFFLAFVVQRFNRLAEINTSFKWGFNCGRVNKIIASVFVVLFFFNFTFANMLIGLQFVQYIYIFSTVD